MKYKQITKTYLVCIFLCNRVNRLAPSMSLAPRRQSLTQSCLSYYYCACFHCKHSVDKQKKKESNTRHAEIMHMEHYATTMYDFHVQ